MTRIVLVGAHVEAVEPFAHVLAADDVEVALLVTLPPGRLAGMSGGTDLAPLAAEHRVPVLRTADINHADTVEAIRADRPDVLLVIGWTRLLGDELLRVPKVATLGFHASLLPRYRGRAPVNWAIINGEVETGNTLMVLDPEADTGDIVAQRRIPITVDDDCATVYEKVSATEIDMLDEVIGMLAAGRPLPRSRQDDVHATVMPKRRPEDGVIDWTRSSRQLHDWVRALTRPYPGAFTHTADGEQVFVWRTAPPDPDRDVAGDGTPPTPGLVSTAADGTLLVGTGDGWLRVTEVDGPIRPGLRLGGGH